MSARSITRSRLRSPGRFLLAAGLAVSAVFAATAPAGAATASRYISFESASSLVGYTGSGSFTSGRFCGSDLTPFGQCIAWLTTNASPAGSFATVQTDLTLPSNAVRCYLNAQVLAQVAAKVNVEILNPATYQYLGLSTYNLAPVTSRTYRFVTTGPSAGGIRTVRFRISLVTPSGASSSAIGVDEINARCDY
jgi:hypothetical protein